MSRGLCYQLKTRPAPCPTVSAVPLRMLPHRMGEKFDTVNSIIRDLMRERKVAYLKSHLSFHSAALVLFMQLTSKTVHAFFFYPAKLANLLNLTFYMNSSPHHFRWRKQCFWNIILLCVCVYQQFYWTLGVLLSFPS